MTIFSMFKLSLSRPMKTLPERLLISSEKSIATTAPTPSSDMPGELLAVAEDQARKARRREDLNRVPGERYDERGRPDGVRW